MTDVNLHELIEMNGAGSAHKAIVKSGNWDKFADTGKGMHLYEVEITCTFEETVEVIVNAANRELAKEMAQKHAEGWLIKGASGDMFGSDGAVMDISVNITEVPE